MSNTLFTPTTLGKLQLKNRIVMAPMTRSRATGNVPNELMEKYYGLRADAGLIITEGTSPSANGLGYARIPGMFSQEQVTGLETRERRRSQGGRQDIHTTDAHRTRQPSGKHADRCKDSRPFRHRGSRRNVDGQQRHAAASGPGRNE